LAEDRPRRSGRYLTSDSGGSRAYVSVRPVISLRQPVLAGSHGAATRVVSVPVAVDSIVPPLGSGPGTLARPQTTTRPGGLAGPRRRSPSLRGRVDVRLRLVAVESPVGSNDAVVSEAGALEVLAYLISAARTQLDEAAEYAPMRLITAAQKLGRHMAPRSAGPVRRVVEVLDAFAPTSTPRTDRDGYIAQLDTVCVALADCLLALSEPSPPEG
jgi:Family of unknown function (DUF6092)